MQLETLDVIDSAIKIGLGGVLGGFASYMKSKADHDNERSKELRSYKLKTIELIAENFELILNAERRFRGMLDAVIKERKTDDGYRLDESAIKNLDDRDEKLLNALDSANIANARLALMDETVASKALAEILSLIVDFRNPIMLERKAPRKEAYEQYEASIKSTRDGFQSELAKIYQAIN